MFEPKLTSKPSKQIDRSGHCLPFPSVITTAPFVIATKRQRAQSMVDQVHNLPISCPPNGFPYIIQARPNGQGGDDSTQRYTLNNWLKSKCKLILAGTF